LIKTEGVEEGADRVFGAIFREHIIGALDVGRGGPAMGWDSGLLPVVGAYEIGDRCFVRGRTVVGEVEAEAAGFVNAVGKFGVGVVQRIGTAPVIAATGSTSAESCPYQKLFNRPMPLSRSEFRERSPLR
jgi:hypothetical protein